MIRPEGKFTKEIIQAYVEGVRAEQTAKKDGTFNPEEIRKEEGKKTAATKAKSLVDRGILSQEIVDEYNYYKDDIENKAAELKELYGIDIVAGTLAVLIEANDLEIAEAARLKNEITKEQQEKVDSLTAEYDAKKAKLDAEYEDKKKEVELKLDRDKKNAEYELNRTKKVDNDAWEDDKKAREAELKARELAVAAREEAVALKEKEYAEMKAEVEALPEKIAKVKKDAQESADKEVEKIVGIRKAAIEKEANLGKQLAEQKLEATEKALAEEKAKHEITAEKLDKAYSQMNELATKTAQSAQPIYSKDNK